MIDGPITCSAHMRWFIKTESLKKYTTLAVDALYGYDFDTIAFRGMSGAFIGVSVAQAMDKQMILVRKPEDTSHSEFKVEGHKEAKRYIILDDFESSGKTKQAIIDGVRDFAPDACYLGFLSVWYINELVFYRRTGKLYPLE